MNCALKLDRKIVGVKFLFDEDEFKKADAKRTERENGLLRSWSGLP